MGRSPKTGKPLGFKPTEQMRAFIERRSEEEDVGLSEIIRRAADIYRDLYEKLGGDWHEAERRSGVTAQSIGSVLAGLVRAALDQERKGRK